MKYTGRTSRNINIKALGLLLCILVASYGIIKAPASDTRKLDADLREKQQLINEEKGKKVEGTSTLPSQPTSALHTAVPADNMPADTKQRSGYQETPCYRDWRFCLFRSICSVSTTV